MIRKEAEEYIWEAVEWFQKYWDINADNFPQMLQKSISKNYNLSASTNYNAGDGIIMAAKKLPKNGGAS